MSAAAPVIAGVLVLAWFAAANLVLSTTAAAIATLVPDQVTADPRRAQRLLALRLLPAAGASVVAFVVFLPAHLWLEPPNSGERLGAVPLTCAAIGLLILLRCTWRVATVAWASTRLAMMPSFREQNGEHTAWVDMPMLQGIVLAGVFHPRILVGAAAKRVLTSEELDVAIAHEAAHRRAGDNMARALMRYAPDVFGLMRSGARIEQLWSAEAECLADARATQGKPQRGAALASALLKVARLSGNLSEPGFSQAWSTFHHPRLLETRVRLLLGNTMVPAAAGRLLTWLAAGTLIAIGLAWTTNVPHAIHQLTEYVISSAL